MEKNKKISNLVKTSNGVKISKSQKLKIAKIAKKFQLKLVVIFGSFAMGKNRKDSDLDIAVLGSREVSFNEQIS